MQLGMIGLGRMGANIVRRVADDGHECVVYDHNPDAVKAMASEERTTGVSSLAELAEKMTTPRVVWVMVPAGDITTSVIEELANTLDSGDIVIDGGNSYYRDDLKHSKLLSEKGIHLLDCGTSGGVWGRERGYCLMIGGDRCVRPRRAALRHHRTRGGRGGAHPGPNRRDRAAGEGLPALWSVRGRPLRQDGAQRHRVRHDGLSRRGTEHPAQCRHRQARQSRATPKPRRCRDPECYQYDFDIADVAEVWRRGSVVGSWLLDLTAIALHESPDLTEFSGRVSDSGEGRWTAIAAIDEGVPAPVLTTALQSRFASRSLD